MTRRTAREELARVLQPVAPAEDPVSRAVCELLARFELGHYRNRPAAHRRLAEIFATNPPGSLDLLTRAAHHLGVTGEHADALLDELMLTWPASLPTPTPTRRLEDAPAHRPGPSPKGGSGKQARP